MNRLAMGFAAMVVAGGVSAALGQVDAAGGAAGGGRGGRGAAAGGPAGALGLNVPFYTGEYDLMVQQLTLTDDEKAKIKDKVDTMNKELDTLLQNAQTTLAGGRGGRGGAAGGGAAAVPAGPSADVLKVRDDYLALADAHQLKIDAELTADQRLQWETYKLGRLFDARLQLVALSDDQREKVKMVVENTVKLIVALPDGKDMQMLEGRAFRSIVGDVLTEAQAAKLLEGVPAAGGRAGAASGGAAAGRGGRGGRRGAAGGAASGGAGIP